MVNFPGLVVKTLYFQCKGHGFDSWYRTKIPHAMQHSQKIKINKITIKIMNKSACPVPVWALGEARTQLIEDLEGSFLSVDDLGESSRGPKGGGHQSSQRSGEGHAYLLEYDVLSCH